MSRISIHPACIITSVMPVIILFVTACYTTAAAQVGAACYDTTLIPLQHTASSVGDSLRYKPGTITIIESVAGRLLDAPGDSVKITLPSGFNLLPDSVITISSSSTRPTGIRLDTAGTSAGTNGLQQGSTGSKLRMKAASNSGSGLYVSFMLKTSSTEPDTVTIDGIYVQSVDTTNVMYDSTTGGVLQLSQIGVPSNATFLSRLTALPGPAARIGFGPASRIPSANQSAGNIINTQPGGSPSADTGRGIVIEFLDRMNNLTSYGTSTPKVRALLSLTNMAGNGALSGTSATHWYGDHRVAMSFDSLCYLKAEKIDLEFSFGGFSINSNTTALSAGITVAPGKAANISASITSKDEYAVDETKKYNLVVTDKYFNPVNPTWIQARELTPHGGIFTGTGIHGDSICTGTGSSLGEAALTFDPSNYFVGRDTLLFIARSSSPAAKHYRDVLIMPGELGGIIADYAPTVNGAALSESVAAGGTVYVRAFLRDSYGNPIDADSKSGITFSLGSILGKNMSLNQSGKVLTNSIEEAQYLNSTNTAVGMAIPYNVSINVRGFADTVVANCENYSIPVLIPIRSSMPAVIKMVQTSGRDSSVVASEHAGTITFSDSVWDAFGNLAEDPGPSVTLEPGHPSYAIIFSTRGLVTFPGVPVNSTGSVIDTSYPMAGVVSRTVSSGEKAGIDTMKSWPASNQSLVVSTPVWITPAVFSNLVLTADGEDVMLAGETRTFEVEKQDAFGNHIDWGLPGGNLRTNSGKITEPTADQITADSAGLHAGAVNAGRNRGGSVTEIYSIVGQPGIASVGGTLAAAFPFTASAAGPDTESIYVKLASGGITAYDTLNVVSTSTGTVRRLQVMLDTTNALSHLAGDSVRITVTARDSSGHRVYTYAHGEHALSLNSTAFDPSASKDTTHHFTYRDICGKHVRSTGVSICDTVFKQGQAVFYLHKFAVDSLPNTVSISGNGCCDTSEASVLFHPLPVDSSYGYWRVEISDTAKLPGTFTFTILPRDRYYNVNPTEQVIVNIASNEVGGVDFGTNPKAVKGRTTFSACSSLPISGLTIYVFNGDMSRIYGEGTIASVNDVSVSPEIPGEFALSQNYPNPFNPSTEIFFELPEASAVRVAVYDILGRSVRTLIDRNMTAGRYRVRWDGLNNGGTPVGAGVYFYRLNAGKHTQVKKMLMLR
ncbi:MAG: T9SS type A sorting domain-containing protein [Bacteroidetes bacterium]|nr:T9SS type A sorting domain-containing protein [Bacteroidota bacterium]